jgi:tetratricopeptide (TPR) repeat protein
VIDTPSETNPQLERLLGYLVTDPTNKILAGEAAGMALSSGQPTVALEILDAVKKLIALDGPLINLTGLAALQSQDYERATKTFQGLLDQSPQSHELCYNLAFSTSRQNDIEGALNLLNEATTKSLPQAALLKVQLLHFQGHFDDAMESVKVALERFPNDIALLGIASVLAMDLEDTPFAKSCAQRSISLYQAGTLSGAANPDALTTIGYLTLDDGDVTSAVSFFDNAIIVSPFAPRAWIGKGLSRVMTGDYAVAAKDITKGAQMFGDHLGSWIAAGWAHVLNKDLVAARAVFEQTLALDGTFSEAHGSLGVIEIMEGNLEAAKALASRALRLDRQSFSGALVTSMLLSSSGNAQAANKIIERALTTPMDGQGRTLTDAMMRMGIKR